MLSSGTWELLGNIQWSPCTLPGLSVRTAVHQKVNVCVVPTTTGLESSGPFGLVILSLLVSAVNSGCQKISKDCCSTWGKVMGRLISIIFMHKFTISIAGTTSTYIHSKNILKCQGDKITHFHVHIMSAFGASVKLLLANCHLFTISEYWLSFMQQWCEYPLVTHILHSCSHRCIHCLT